MTANKKTLFISDLHLEENQPEITRQFLQLLAECDSTCDALYILGDLFEAWIGDDEDTPLHHQIIHALKSATDKGLSIYFLHGNRDFLIGKKFLRATGCKLLSDEEKIILYGIPVLLMHGDTLCTRDIAYLKARKKSRNHFLQFLFLSLPLTFRRKIADNMRKKSERYKENVSMEIMDVTQEEVERVMQKHHVYHLIHGHTHRPATHQFSLQQAKAERIVLPAWHGHGSVLIWDETGQKTLLDLK